MFVIKFCVACTAISHSGVTGSFLDTPAASSDCVGSISSSAVLLSPGLLPSRSESQGAIVATNRIISEVSSTTALSQHLGDKMAREESDIAKIDISPSLLASNLARLADDAQMVF